MMVSMQRAMRMDTVDEATRGSKAVDYVFFVVQRCVLRSLSTFNVDVVCTLINITCARMNGQYREMFARPVQGNAFSLARFVPNASNARARATAKAIALNSLDTSAGLLSRMRTELSRRAAAAFGSKSPKTSKVVERLSELDDVRADFESVRDEGIAGLLADLSGTLKTLFEPHMMVGYELSAAAAAAASADDPFITGFIAALDNALTWHRSSLSESNLHRLAGSLLQLVAGKLETSLLRKKFNPRGAFQLGAEVQQLAAYFGTLAPQDQVRERVRRLREASTLLAVDTAKDAAELYDDGGGAVGWKLAPGEVRRLLRLRTDFDLDEVNSLNLR
jgi:hypothetical protein